MLWEKFLIPCVACLILADQLPAQSPLTTNKPCPAEIVCEPTWKFDAGAGFYFIQPFFNNNVAYSVTTSSTLNGGNAVSGQTLAQQFSWGMQPAFEVWMGVTSSSGLGLRARYFYLDSMSNESILSIPSTQYNAAGSTVIAVTPSPYLFNSPPGTVPQQNPALAGLFSGPSPFVVNFPGAPASVDQFTFQSDLQLDAIDLEVTGTLTGERYTLSGGVGGRYFHMTQGYRATLINSNGLGAILSETLDSNRDFQGGGPTVSGQFNVRPFPFHSNFSLFAGGRGSLVVGETTQTTTGNRTLNDPTGAFNPIGIPSSTSNSFQIPFRGSDTIPIVELELGFEYAVSINNCIFTFRGAAVDQTYFGAGNASRSDGNLSLLGFKFSGGITY
jgi:hypothetical protein